MDGLGGQVLIYEGGDGGVVRRQPMLLRFLSQSDQVSNNVFRGDVK